MPKHGKKYLEAAKLVDRKKLYQPTEAVEIAKKAHFAKFDETVELHMRTGLDPRHADQQVRSTALLPHGLGKAVRVLVFAEGEAAQAARDAGADFVGSDELIAQIQGGWTDFDVALAQRELMGKVGRLGRVSAERLEGAALLGSRRGLRVHARGEAAAPRRRARVPRELLRGGRLRALGRRAAADRD